MNLHKVLQVLISVSTLLFSWSLPRRCLVSLAKTKSEPCIRNSAEHKRMWPWRRNSRRSRFALELFVLRSRKLRAECNPQMSSSCHGKLPSCLAFNLPLVASLVGTANGGAQLAGLSNSTMPPPSRVIPPPRLKTNGFPVSRFPSSFILVFDLARAVLGIIRIYVTREIIKNFLSLILTLKFIVLSFDHTFIIHFIVFGVWLI